MRARAAVPLLVLLASAACKEPILHDLDELRANQVQLTLLQAAIPADKSRSGKLWSVAVPRSDVAAALSILERSRILRKDLERGTEQQSGILQTSGERAHLAMRQIALRTEQTLEHIPGVVEARVHLHREVESLLASDPLAARRSAGSASVLLLTTGEESITSEETRALVAGAAGLRADDISVLRSVLPAANAKSPAVPARPRTAGTDRSWVPSSGYAGAAGVLSGSAVLCLLAIRRGSRLRRLRTEDLRRTPGDSLEVRENAGSRLRNPFGREAVK